MINFSPINATINNSPRIVALAILYREGKFLMQLRDNIPNIVHPGVWGLFGGHIEAEETPADAVVREVQEEINYQMVSSMEFGCYADKEAVRHVFYAPLTVCLEQLSLEEGWDFDLLTPQAIQQGQYYSAKARQIRPLGLMHRTILLDFLCAELT